jgi:hypothetical protein
MTCRSAVRSKGVRHEAEPAGEDSDMSVRLLVIMFLSMSACSKEAARPKAMQPPAPKAPVVGYGEIVSIQLRREQTTPHKFVDTPFVDLPASAGYGFIALIDSPPTSSTVLLEGGHWGPITTPLALFQVNDLMYDLHDGVMCYYGEEICCYWGGVKYPEVSRLSAIVLRYQSGKIEAGECVSLICSELNSRPAQKPDRIGDYVAEPKKEPGAPVPQTGNQGNAGTPRPAAGDAVPVQ